MMLAQHLFRRACESTPDELAGVCLDLSQFGLKQGAVANPHCLPPARRTPTFTPGVCFSCGAVMCGTSFLHFCNRWSNLSIVSLVFGSILLQLGHVMCLVESGNALGRVKERTLLAQSGCVSTSFPLGS